MVLLSRIWAFVARDWLVTVSYRMQFFLRVLSVLIAVTTLFFISKIFVGFTDVRFAEWRDPLAAWLTGLAVLNYFMTGFSSLANAIRQEQMQGTLESVLMTPISVPTVVVASSAWDFVEATFFSLLYLIFGWLFFDVHYRGSALLALVFLLLTTLVLSCLGILLGTGSALFSGVFFPTQLINQHAGSGVASISKILPPTYGLDGIRRVLIEGQGFSQVYEPFVTLLAFLAVLLPFSLWVFGRAVRRAKREGSLIQY